MKSFFPFVSVFVLCFLLASLGYAQYPVPLTPSTNIVPAATPAPGPQMILDVRIEGNVQISNAEITKIIKSREDRPFNETVLEEDKRALLQRTWFIDVKIKVDKTPDGYIITFQCIERPLIHYIKVTGNHSHTKKVLLEEANIKEGDALDPIAIHQAAERIAQFYRDSGYHQVYVEIVRGDELGDRGVIFRVSEGPKQRVLGVEFEGNQITSSGRLKTLIQTKPGFFFWINSDFTRKKLDEDVEILTNYYRKLGFFYAKIDRVFEETAGYSGMGQNRGWVKVKFVIDEGPRCKIRKIQFVGNNVFDQETLLKKMKMAEKKTLYYNQDMLEIDMLAIKELYGNEGYVFAMPAPDPRVDQDYVDLVVNIKEGPRCYLETLDVEIVGMDGSESYTKWYPVLNRTSIRPGDILRTSEINATKRRLMASQLFNSNPTQGAMPDFVFEYPKAALEAEAAAAAQEAEEKNETAVASGEPQIRGQAPSKPFYQKLLPSTLTPSKRLEPTIRFSPNSAVPIQTAPPVQTIPPPVPAAPQQSYQGIYRGQAPAPLGYTASAYVPPASPAVQTQPDSAYLYPGRTSAPSSGSTAPAPAPLQLASASESVGMTPTQFRQPYQSGYQTEQPQATILGNPFDTISAPSNVRIDPLAPTGASPYIYGAPGKIIVQETRTGSVMASIAVSSDAGLMGRFIYEEQNFDLTNIPKGFRLSDWGKAFRGKGQRFRIEAVPGTQVQRYSASWESPYWLDLDSSFGISGFYYQRYYDEWYEDRVGGTLSFGKLWTQDFQTRLSLGAQSVEVYRPMIWVPDLLSALGKHPMYNIGLSAIHNTRDSEYLPTEGHMISAGVEQILGDYQFMRANIDLRKYIMLRERPDRSGRWVLGLRSSLAVTESGTPIYERYFGGGFTNLRGFEFRGVSPRDEYGYVTGGGMEFYNSAEMIFPLTADDMIRGSVFIDTGTVEKSISNWEENYRVAVGFGLRLTIPMMGPAPIALDFAFPLSTGRGDVKEVFSFGMSMIR